MTEVNQMNPTDLEDQTNQTDRINGEHEKKADAPVQQKEQRQAHTKSSPISPKRVQANCDYCLYYEQDEETGMAECQVNLDQDEMARYLGGKHRECPYFHVYDEYKTVRKQI